MLTEFVGDPSPCLSLDDTAALSSQSSVKHFILTTTPPADSGITSMSSIIGQLEDLTLHPPGQGASGIVSNVTAESDQNNPSALSWSPDIIPELCK